MHPGNVIAIAPNCALSNRAAGYFFASVCLPVLLVAFALTAKGYWPVLPFAGLELLLLAWALHRSLSRGEWREIIYISDSEVRVEKHRGEQHAEMVFTRHWAQVKLRRARTPWHPSQLMIQSHGRACELGSFLTEAARRALAERLALLVGRVNESPPLERQTDNI
jgi:uncharacterized membrane protein